MAVCRLPSWPGPSSVTPRPISSRNEQRPSSSGPVNRYMQPGTRWAWECVMPPMTYVESLAFDDLLSEADTVRWQIPQPGLPTGTPGTAIVDGPGTALANAAAEFSPCLVVQGMTPSYAFRKGQWISFEIAGQTFAYKARDYCIALPSNWAELYPNGLPFSDGSFFADGAGHAAPSGPAPGGACLIKLRTMLRRMPPDGTLVNVAAPEFEGFPAVDPASLEIDTDGFVRLKFTIEERE